jgi:hypothetical protein
VEVKGKCCGPFGLLYQNTIDWVAIKNKKHLFLTVLKAEKYKVKMPADCFFLTCRCCVVYGRRIKGSF